MFLIILLAFVIIFAKAFGKLFPYVLLAAIVIGSWLFIIHHVIVIVIVMMAAIGIGYRLKFGKR
ncbi:MAG: hypothetical protein ABF635_10775 [Liquorilactobacillus satsumensis]|uniref:hypothetical protein n=1 Tax=Lactobacillaceae TaxID=33958 RepID=UPI0039ECF9DE